MEVTRERMYQACLEKDAAFEGRFFVAVKTTGIFCRPICRARKPKFANVEFFESAAEALAKGYRACKVCKPLEALGQPPAEIIELLNELINKPATKIKDTDLRNRGLAPSKIRRWFVKNHGTTFHDFQRKLRINIALTKLQTGESVTNTAFESGFESLSGFGERFKSIVGQSPKNYKPLPDRGQ
jgi:AraC family transcriptional regulator, regulatory protein of adaptative response / methylated-DNA-[protein]-cysteine methyltransferase